MNLENITKVDVLNILQSSNVHQMEIDEVVELLKKFMHGYQINCLMIEEGKRFFRARKIKDISDVEFLNGLSYRNPAEVTQFQRCNRPGRSLFYCSTAVVTPFFEIDLEAGDLVALSTWINTEVILASIISYTKEAFSLLGTLRTVPFDDNEIQHEFSTWIAKTFIQKVPSQSPEFYKLSIAIAEFFSGYASLNKPIGRNSYLPNQIPAMLYPSVSLKGNGDNLAISPSFVDQYMRFQRVDLIRVLKINDDKIHAITVDSAVSFDQKQKLQWTGIPLVAVKDDGVRIEGPITLEAVNGGWLSYDKERRNVRLF